MVSLSPPASGTPDVGLFGTPAPLSSSVLSVIPGDGGRLVGECCVVILKYRGVSPEVQSECEIRSLSIGASSRVGTA